MRKCIDLPNECQVRTSFIHFFIFIFFIIIIIIIFISTEEKVRERVNKFIGSKRVWLWVDDHQILSVVMSTRETPTAQGINSVYTPAAHRCKGYAVALVAKATQYMLETERERGGDRNTVFLFADLDYPASNAVYVKVGFVPIEDSVQWVQ